MGSVKKKWDARPRDLCCMAPLKTFPKGLQALTHCHAQKYRQETITESPWCIAPVAGLQGGAGSFCQEGRCNPTVPFDALLDSYTPGTAKIPICARSNRGEPPLLSEPSNLRLTPNCIFSGSLLLALIQPARKKLIFMTPKTPRKRGKENTVLWTSTAAACRASSIPPRPPPPASRRGRPSASPAPELPPPPPSPPARQRESLGGLAWPTENGNLQRPHMCLNLAVARRRWPCSWLSLESRV